MSNERRLTCSVDPARAQALFATLGEARGVNPGDLLPPFFHQIYFWDPKPAGELGPDGHPALGGFLPDLGFPRRMWAGGRLRFHAPLRAGVPATLTSRVTSAEQKEGRAGPMAVVTVSHQIDQEGLILEEEQDLVYLPADFERPPPKHAPEAAESEPLAFNPTTLFRYSGLTFNGHRIHYDRDYATGVEGYAGLVVHGPLLAQHLMLFAERALGPLKSFSFRALAPLMDFESAKACRAGSEFWIEGPDGRLCLTAEASA